MDDFKLFGRSPTLWLSLITAGLIFLGTFGFGWLTPDNALQINAALLALNGFAVALLVRPFQPAAFTGVLNAILAVAAGYGFNLTPEQQAALSAFGLTVITLLLYGNVSPIKTLVTKASLDPTAAAMAHEVGALDPHAIVEEEDGPAV